MPLLDSPPPWTMPEAGGRAGAGGDEPQLYRGTGVELLAQAGAALSDERGVARMRRAIEELDPEGLLWHRAQRGNDAALRWAAAVVQSRAHASRAGRTALVPLADCFNHSTTSPNIELSEEESAFQVFALRPIAAQEELLLSYGPFSNAELLFNAGFACLPNPDDCVMVSREELLAAAQRRWSCREGAAPTTEELRQRLLHLSRGLPPPKLRLAAPLLGAAVPPGVVTLLSGLMLEPEAWQEHGEDGPGNLHDCWASERSLAAEELRGEVMQTLNYLIEFSLRPRYASSHEADASELRAAELPASEGGASEVARQRRVNILRVRVGEQRVLERLAEVIRMRLGLPRTAPSASGGQPPAKRARAADGDSAGAEG